jgi:hypothetical protein
MIDPYIGCWNTVFASDLDGDGDRDALAGSACGDLDFLSWYENTDGAGTFVFVADIGLHALFTSVSAADMDNDGDSDVIASNIGGFVWLENLDGLGSFSELLTIDWGLCAGFHVQSTADVDGDGDVDVLASVVCDLGGNDPEEIAWYENIHSASGFAPKSTISTGVQAPRYPLGADLDGDGDLDAVSASSDDGKIAWYENTDGAGSFGDQQLISTSAAGAWALHAADIDGDGDQDVLSVAETANAIAWYENESDDCNGNTVPDSCEPDCDGNGVVDACDIRGGVSRDCDADGVPDQCHVTCPTCDADGDGCLDEVDTYPFYPYRCADSDFDGCDDCTSGTYDPSSGGPNSDSDGVCDVGDCDPLDNEVWGEPASIPSLRVGRSGDMAHLVWQPPEERGAVHLRYDTLRSTVASDFVDAALCLESDGTDTECHDRENPVAGSVFFYLVRVENGCPGGSGAMGYDSDGIERTGRACESRGFGDRM